MSVKIMDCDLVVLGAGGSGLVAGVRAFDLTGKKVIVLEKSKKPAGCTYFAGGMGESGPITDSTWQKEAGYEVSETPDVSGQFFDWLVTKGDAKNAFTVSKPGEPGRRGGIGLERQKKYRNKPDETIGPGGMGSFVVDTLSQCCRDQGIDLLTETRARKFITDSSGKLTAVLADTPDGELLVNCRACIVAAGGYGANRKLLKKYYPKQFNGGKIHSLCPPAITGDGILAAQEIGAYVDPTIRDLSFPGGFYGDGVLRHPWSTSLLLLTSGKCVLTNLDGKRWMNEDGTGGSRDEYIGDQRDGVAIAIVDSTIVAEAAANPDALDSIPGVDPSGDFEKDLAAEIAMDEAGARGNHAKKADTLVELALKMKIDPRALVDTIDRYNTFCETGKDIDFGKSAGMLQKIRTPPFYAVYGNRWSQSTKGRNGISVNAKFQAVDSNGEAMPGLYAAGDGCTIFGGLSLNIKDGGHGTVTKEWVAARAALSKDLFHLFDEKKAAPREGAPEGGGQGGMPMMAGGPESNVLETEGAPCGGLGPAFLSGYCAGTYAAKYLMDL